MVAPIWCSVCGHRSQVLWKHSVTQLQSSDPSALRCCAAVTGSHNAFIAEILGSKVCGASDAQHPMLRSLRSSYFSFSAYFEAREIECIRSLGPHFWVNSLPPSAELQDCAPRLYVLLAQEFCSGQEPSTARFALQRLPAMPYSLHAVAGSGRRVHRVDVTQPECR